MTAATGVAAEFVIGEYFELALLSAVLYSMELVLIGYLVPGKVRKEVFNRDFMLRHFEQEHRDTTS